MLIGGAVALVLVLVVGLVIILGGDDGNGPVADDEPGVSSVGTDADDPAVTAADGSVEGSTPGDGTEIPAVTAMDPSAEQLAASVVQIIAPFEGGACTGSGTIIDSAGLVLTNQHVVERSEICPWEDLVVATIDRPDLPPLPLFRAEVVAADPALDLAVIRIAERLDGGEVVPNFPVIEIGDSEALELGERLRVFGFPGVGGETITFTEGTISGFVEQPGLGQRSWLKTDTAISGGNSGGLAADDRGRIVGVPTRVGTNDSITDCRIVADTNRDGTIDENDTCVPTGGFVNGVRPISLALALIEEARAAPATVPEETAPPTEAPVSAPLDTEPSATAPSATAPAETAPEQTTPPPDPPPISPADPAAVAFAFNPRFSLTTTDGLPDPEVFVVPDGSTQLCLTWEYENVPTGTPFVFGWNIDGELEEASVVDGVNEGAAEGQFFGCITNDAGLVPGLYEAIWVVEDEAVFIHSTYVGNNPIGVVVAVENTGDPICVVQWAPADSVSPGLPRNTAAFSNGERFETVLPPGRYQTQVLDCDGEVVFSDPDSLFDSDLTLTL